MVEATDILLTTKDNEFNPFTQYDDWKHFDSDYGYHTEEYWSRVLGLKSDFSENQLALELMEVFEEIINMNNELGFDVYQVITRDGERFDHVPPSLLMSKSPQVHGS